MHWQLQCQGTTDLLLSACSHVWTGTDLAELDATARRKAADFYLRHSMTGFSSLLT